VLAGLDVAEAVFREVDGSLSWSAACRDGQVIQAGVVVAEVRGSARAILTGERCALNFLQRLSGVATKTAEYVNAVTGTTTKILDTRKTTPGLRALERQAVRSGGGTNHRAGLYDGILVKENHQVFMAAGIWEETLRKAREEHPDLCLVVEADNVELAGMLLSQPIDRVLLDNMSNDEVSRVVALRKKMGSRVQLEASGGVTVVRARELSVIGVEWVSVGGLTHSARAIDFSLDLGPE
jgi:nicotinate-nucleotide pyrophosphorylase (carboxylating)